MHLAMARTVEAQTAEEAKVSPNESCDWKPVIDLLMPAMALTDQIRSDSALSDPFS